MTLEGALLREKLENDYAGLKARMPRLVAHVNGWAGDATALHGALTDPAEKAEVIALRDQLVADINAALGV